MFQININQECSERLQKQCELQNTVKEIKKGKKAWKDMHSTEWELRSIISQQRKKIYEEETSN